MLRKIKYFQEVVKCGSFSQAAENCFISQSAISQQIMSLERELGVELISRKNRTFDLTPTGEYFYRHSLDLINRFDKLVNTTKEFSCSKRILLRFGYLRGFEVQCISDLLRNFSDSNVDIELKFYLGDHEELFHGLKDGRIDIILSDQRRAFSKEYRNDVLGEFPLLIETSAFSNQTARTIELNQLNELSCSLICSSGNFEKEKAYYREVIGLESSFKRTENMDLARLNNSMYSECFVLESLNSTNSPTNRFIVTRNGEKILRKYCLFAKKENYNPAIDALIETFISH